MDKTIYDWNCLFCDTKFEVTEDKNGECPVCKEKFIWDFDGDYGEFSVWTVCFINAGVYTEEMNEKRKIYAKIANENRDNTTPTA